MSRQDIKKLLKDRSAIRLDIACGRNKQGSNWVGIDIQDFPEVDVVHNLEEYPWPLPNESVSLAVASHYIEHINPADFGVIKFFNEVWRILKYDGELAIITPYGGSPGFWQDPTHLKGFTEASFYYFDPLHPSGYYRFYTPKPWKIKETVYNRDGNLQVVLVKRREDKSYEKN